MSEKKRILGNKDTGQTVPECLDGKVTHDTILERFKDCYEQLYNSAGSEDAMTTVKSKLENIVTTDVLGSEGDRTGCERGM